MGIFDGVLIASDLDGTLLGKDHSLSAENRAALEYYMGAGGKFAVATGRSPLGARWLRPWEFSNAPAVLSNGGVLYDYAGQKALYVDKLGPEAREASVEIAKAFPAAGIEVHNVERKAIINRNSQIDTHLQYVHCEGGDVPSIESADGEWIKVLFVDEAETISAISAFAREHYGDKVALVFSNPWMLELQNKGTHKGAGVKALADLLGIDHGRVYTAGDEGNDLEMIREFESFAPANATDEIKAAADHMLPHCDEHAMAALVDYLKERYT